MRHSSARLNRGKISWNSTNALEQLSSVDPRAAELVKLRFFVGLTGDQAAEALGISARSADRSWAYARAWLFAKLQRNRLRRSAATWSGIDFRKIFARGRLPISHVDVGGTSNRSNAL